MNPKLSSFTSTRCAARPSAKGGAGATMGAREIANAKPDGYTLAILPSPVFRMPHMQNVGYDPLKDFSYINMLSGYVLGVAVKSTSPYKTWDEFVDGARANPQAVTYGTARIGSASYRPTASGKVTVIG